MIPVLLLTLLCAPHLQAAEISYAQALEGALSRNPTLVQAEASLLSSEGSLVSAKGSFDPYLTLGAAHQTSISESFSQFGQVASETHRNGFDTSLSQFLPTGTSLALDWSVDSSTYLYELLESGMTFEMEEPQRYSTLSASVRQSLLQGHRMAYNLQAVREAERAVSRAEASLAATRLQAVADTATAYWNLHTMREFEDIARQALAVAQEEGRVVQAMVDAGQLAPVEATRVQAAVVQARRSLIEAEHSHRLASETLAQLLGSDPADLIQATSAPEPPVALSLDDARVVEASLEGNPELLVYRSSVESARVSVANAKHARLPELSLTGGVGLNGYDPSFDEAFAEMFSGDLRFWSVGADLSVPLGNRADRGAVWQAEAALAQAQQQLEVAERSVAAQVLAQVRKVEAGLVQVELAEANLALAEATLSAEKARQREGRAIQKDVLEALRAHSNAQASLVLARTDYVLSLVELGRLQGRIEGVAR
jgi:outer membrane protein TolC